MEEKKEYKNGDGVTWNYSLIALIKSISYDELSRYGYKYMEQIQRSDIDTAISRRGEGYIFLEDFGVKQGKAKLLLDGNGDSEMVKMWCKKKNGFGRMEQFYQENNIDIGYLYGEKLMMEKQGKAVIGNEKIPSIKNYFANNRKNMIMQVVGYLNECKDNDPLEVWFKHFKNMNCFRNVPELQRLSRELKALDIDRLIEYRGKNPKALKEIYHMLNQTAINVGIVYAGKKYLSDIINKFDIEEKVKESGIEL